MSSLKKETEPILELDKDGLQHINCILGDLIALYNPLDRPDTWWAKRLYAFRDLGLLSPQEINTAKREFCFYARFLRLAHPERRYKRLESYLWSEPVRKLLLEPVGFLEGNFLILPPGSVRLIQPHIDNPLRSICFPHIGFNRRTAVDLALQRFSNDDLTDGLRELAKYFSRYRPFPRLREEDRNQFFQCLESAIRAVFENRKLGLKVIYEPLGEAINLLEEPRPGDEELTWRKFFAKRLVEYALYMMTTLKLKLFREESDNLEFLKFLKGIAPRTVLEGEAACVFMEDGQISLHQFIFEWLKWHEINRTTSKIDDLGNPYLHSNLVRAGLVSVDGQATERARRMVRWLQKAAGLDEPTLRSTVGGLSPHLNKHYHALFGKADAPDEDSADLGTSLDHATSGATARNADTSPELEISPWGFLLDHWEDSDSNKRTLATALCSLVIDSESRGREQERIQTTVSLIKEPSSPTAVGTEFKVTGPLPSRSVEPYEIKAYREFATQWLALNEYTPDLSTYWGDSAANWGIHEFLRRNETGPRSFFAFSFSNLVDERAWQAVFVGTCNLGNGVEGETLEQVEKHEADLLQRLSLIKQFLTITGWPVVAAVQREEQEKLRADAEWAGIVRNIGHAIAAPLNRISNDLTELAQTLDDPALIRDIQRMKHRLFGTAAIKDLLLFLKEQEGFRRGGMEYEYALRGTDGRVEEDVREDLELSYENLRKWTDEAIDYIEAEGERIARKRASQLRENRQTHVIIDYPSDFPHSLGVANRKRGYSLDKWEWVSDREKAIIRVVMQELCINAIKHGHGVSPAINVRIIPNHDSLTIWVIGSRDPGRTPILTLDDPLQSQERWSGMMLLRTAIKGGLGWQIDALADDEVERELGCKPILDAAAVQAFRISAPYIV